MSAGFALVLFAAAAVVAWILVEPFLRARRRARQRARTLDEADRMFLRRRVPVFVRMPKPLQERLEGLTRVFLAEKEFIGCQGITVTPHMKLAIAAQACLLVLGRDEHVYDAMRSILVYPGQFVVPGQWHDEHGVVTEEERVLAGEAWDVSRIILSWEDVKASGRGPDAYNVVIHEFAHYLDHEAGAFEQAGVLAGELESLRAAVDRDEDTLLDPYAAEDEAEFFAVTSEVFFEQPGQLQRCHPRIYDALAGFYRLDPAAWS